MNKLNHGYIFACSKKTEKECFDRMLFAAGKTYAPKVTSIRKGDVLFLLNVSSDVLYGPFEAASDGSRDLVAEAWHGKYPYQVEVKRMGKTNSFNDARNVLSKFRVNWSDNLDPIRTKLLISYLDDPPNFDWPKARKLLRQSDNEYDDSLKPPLQSTTLWQYPRQSYGKTPQGDNKYAGVTPAFIIYNLLMRYAAPNDVVLDPMAGSGTTIDVCKEEGVKCVAFDIVPTRKDIRQGDARKLPIDRDSVDLIFVDSPYGDNIRYNEHADNIGNLSAESDQFYEELEKVIRECHRVLKPGKVLAWLIADQWIDSRFCPVGHNLYQRLCKYFETIDIISVARNNQSSNTSEWHTRAINNNFFLRGFKYLFIMSKGPFKESRRKNTKWTFYPR